MKQTIRLVRSRDDALPIWYDKGLYSTELKYEDGTSIMLENSLFDKVYEKIKDLEKVEGLKIVQAEGRTLE